MHYKSTTFLKENFNEVDDNGVLKNVVIVQEGIDKDLGYFTPDFINALVKHSNEQPKGVKSRFGHPNMCKTTLGTFIGRYKNFRAVQDGDKLKAVADLYLDDITKQTQVEGQGISYFEYITTMAKSNPDMFGNSIHFTGGATYEDKEIEGETREVEVYEFRNLIASDLVDSPAATDELFKSSDDFGVLGTQFLNNNPEIFKAVEANPHLIDDFFSRYKSYIKQKQMNILKKVKQAVGISKDIALTLASGDIVSVITDAEKPQVGDKVVDEDGNIITDGEHLLPDGGAIITENGAISEIKDKPVEEPTEDTEQVENLQKDVDALKATIEEQNTTHSKHIEELTKSVELLAENFATLQKSIGSKYTAPKKEKKDKIVKSKEDEVYNRFRKNKEE